MAVRARRGARRYDEARGCYVYDVSFTSKPEPSGRARGVAEAFGLGLDGHRWVLYDDFELRLAEGDIVYVTGDSGSGKSVLMRAIAADLGDQAADLSGVEADSGPLIDGVGATFAEAMSLLSRVGLNDAHLMLQTYGELSEGQRYRFRLAKMIESGRRFWLADEFCSSLDRVTAKIVAYNTQRQARRCGATLIAATSHTDLAEDLNPSLTIRKGWGMSINATYAENREALACTAARGITIHEGTKEDYKLLSTFHYRDSCLPVPLRIFAAEKNSEVVGVIAYSYPGIRAAGRRRAVGYNPNVEELNSDWALISRVIVHPLYRTTGLGTRLVRETLPLVGRRHVELVAVMAEYNPFAEKAGMTLIQTTPPHPSIGRAVAELVTMGFSPILLSSCKHNLTTINHLGSGAVTQIKRILVDVNSIYYKRLTSSSAAYVKKQQAIDILANQNHERLAKTIQNLAVLNQSKAYLHWSNVEKTFGSRGENQSDVS